MPKLLGLSMECVIGQLRGFFRYVVRFASGNWNWFNWVMFSALLPFLKDIRSTTQHASQTMK